MRYPWWGPGGDPFGYRPARRWRVPFAPPPHHGYRPRIVVRGDPVSSTGQAVFSPVRRGLLSSCRTPMRYPWWGPGGDPFGYRPARRWRVPFAPPPHHGYRLVPVRRGKSSSCRTPMRYPWWGPGGDPFGYRPARRWRVPFAPPPHHGYRPRIVVRGDPVSSTGQAVFSPVRRGSLLSSCRTPMRYPWWGPGGDPFGYRPARSRCGPPAVTPPWIPVFTGKTRAVRRRAAPRCGTHPSPVLPHPDAVSMVGPGRRPLRLQTRSTLARTLRTATPPWIPAPHRSAG